MKNRRNFIIGATTLVLIALILGDQFLNFGVTKRIASVVSPVGIVFSNTGSSIGSFFSGFGKIAGLQRENNNLRDKLNAALAELAVLSEAKKENDSLKKDLGFAGSNSYTYIPGVISTFDPTLRDGINVRVDDVTSVKVGAPVVAEGFLIGRVQKIDGNIAKIQLVTDSASAIPSTIMNKAIAGVAKGQIGNGLTLDQIPQSDNVAKDDLVLTSGLGGDLPKGLILGKVTQVQKISGSIFQQIELAPMVEATKIERVMIIK